MKKLWNKYKNLFLMYLLSTIIGASYGYLVVSNMDDLTLGAFMFRYLEGIFFFICSIILQIILHETGHMIAALIRGWKFLSFMLFGFAFCRKGERFVFSRLNISGAGGQCLMMPPARGDTEEGILLYHAGGIIMNIFVACITLTILILACPILSYEMASLLLGLTMSGILFALINGIPKAAGDLPNDGDNFIATQKDPFSTHVFLETMRLIGLMQQGQTLRELKPDYFCETFEPDYSNPIHAMAISFDLSLANIRHDFNRAHTIIDRIRPHQAEFIPFYLNEIYMEWLYLSVVAPKTGDCPEKLMTEQLRKHMEQQIRFRPTAFRIQYAWALYQHNQAEAERLYIRFREVCRRYHIPGEIPAERELIEYVQSLYTDSRSTSTAYMAAR